tara:strand:- start:34334 stop:34609 length:276 start_codon:yes stop_codon:yes gene_type:complete
MKNLKIINEHFENFIDHVKEIRDNVNEEGEFSRGYLECMKEVINGAVTGEQPKWMENVERLNDMRLRKEVIDEMLAGLEGLLKAYKTKVDE